MTAARVFNPDNRLAKVLVTLGGVSSNELVKAADKRVTDLGGEIRTFVADELRLINAYADRPDDVLFAESAELGQRALNVSEVAGAAGLVAVGEVARGISSMVENLRNYGVWHADALRVHLNAMVLLTVRSGVEAGDEDVILGRLKGMRGAIGVIE